MLFGGLRLADFGYAGEILKVNLSDLLEQLHDVHDFLRHAVPGGAID